MLEFKNPTDLK